MANSHGKKRGVPNKQAIQQKAQAHAMQAIEVLVDAMINGDNTNAKVGAAKVILNKCLPDLKAAELTGRDGESLSKILVRFIDDSHNKHTD